MGKGKLGDKMKGFLELKQMACAYKN